MKECLVREALEARVGMNRISDEFFENMIWRTKSAIEIGTLNLLYGDAIMFNKDYPGEMDVVLEEKVSEWIEKYNIVELVREFNPKAAMIPNGRKEKEAQLKAEIKELLKQYCDSDYKMSCIAALAVSEIKTKVWYAFGLVMPPISPDEMEELYEKSGLKAYIMKKSEEKEEE